MILVSDTTMVSVQIVRKPSFCSLKNLMILKSWIEKRFCKFFCSIHSCASVDDIQCLLGNICKKILFKQRNVNAKFEIVVINKPTMKDVENERFPCYTLKILVNIVTSFSFVNLDNNMLLHFCMLDAYSQRLKYNNVFNVI